jgi:osmotically-inducible protein OsmY
MKLLVHAVAAALAAGAIPFASAQDAVQYVQEPVASVSTNTGPDGPLAEAIAQELNADASLKNSKVTVQPVEGGITLTGTTQTYEQMRRVVKVATAQAGAGRVVNAIASAEMVVPAPEPGKIAAFEAEEASPSASRTW